MAKTKILKVENPFSDSFVEKWEFWKRYKKSEHKFSYKSAESEQAALNKLVRLSNGDEKTAAEIIIQSVENGWKGLFALTESSRAHADRFSKKGTISGESLNAEFAKYYRPRDKGK